MYLAGAQLAQTGPVLGLAADDSERRLSFRRCRQVLPAILGDQKIVLNSDSTHRHEALEYRFIDVLRMYGGGKKDCLECFTVEVSTSWSAVSVYRTSAHRRTYIPGSQVITMPGRRPGALVSPRTLFQTAGTILVDSDLSSVLLCTSGRCWAICLHFSTHQQDSCWWYKLPQKRLGH